MKIGIVPLCGFLWLSFYWALAEEWPAAVNALACVVIVAVYEWELARGASARKG